MKYLNSYGHAPHNNIIKVHLCVSGSSLSLSSHWKIMTVKWKRKVWLQFNGTLSVFFLSVHSTIFGAHIKFRAQSISITIRAVRTLFYLVGCFGSKNQMCVYAHRLCWLHSLRFFHFVSAHHFHPFYGFKINRKNEAWIILLYRLFFSSFIIYFVASCCCCYDFFFVLLFTTNFWFLIWMWARDRTLNCIVSGKKCIFA